MNIYSTFYRPNKPQGIEQRKAHIVGGGIAGLAAAVFLIDDAGMPGKNITIYEKRRDMGGCCGVIGTEGAYICPGERELEPYMECLWYLCSKIPSLDTPGRTVLDETVDVNRESAIHSECRCLVKQGHIISSGAFIERGQISFLHSIQCFAAAKAFTSFLSVFPRSVPILPAG